MVKDIISRIHEAKYDDASSEVKNSEKVTNEECAEVNGDSALSDLSSEVVFSVPSFVEIVSGYRAVKEVPIHFARVFTKQITLPKL